MGRTEGQTQRQTSRRWLDDWKLNSSSCWICFNYRRSSSAALSCDSLDDYLSPRCSYLNHCLTYFSSLLVLSILFFCFLLFHSPSLVLSFSRCCVVQPRPFLPQNMLLKGYSWLLQWNPITFVCECVRACVRACGCVRVKERERERDGEREKSEK